MIVNADVDELPTSATALVRSAGIAGDTVSYTLETPELFDVDVDDLAWALAFIATFRLGRLQIPYPVQSQAAEDAADGGLPVWRWRRKASMTVHVVGGVWLGDE